MFKADLRKLTLVSEKNRKKVYLPQFLKWSLPSQITSSHMGRRFVRSGLHVLSRLTCRRRFVRKAFCQNCHRRFVKTVLRVVMGGNGEGAVGFSGYERCQSNAQVLPK